jgi:multiple sugar transport system substrate-binding protein
MKKLWLLWFGLAFLSGLASAQKVTINFWTHAHPQMIEYNKLLIAEYQKANPNVTINYQSFPTDEYLTKLKAALATGSGPDAFDLFDGDLPSYHSKNQLAPVEPKSFGFDTLDAMKKAWLLGSLEGSTFGGKAYQIPMEFNTFSLFVNTDLYKKAGLDPEKDVPKTWEELGKVGQKIANLSASPKIEGFKWPVPKLGDVWAEITFEPVLRQFGGSVLAADGKSSTINSPQAVAALKAYAELITKYKTGDQNSGRYDGLTPNEDFAQGTLAHWISGPWAIPTLENKPVWGKFKVVPLPQQNPAKPVTLLYAWGWSVNAASKQQSEAWKWISYLSSKGEQWLDRAGYIQPRLGWETGPVAKKTPFLDVFLEDMKRGQYTVRSVNYSEITKAVNNMIQRVMMQGQDAQASANQAKKEIDDILK